MLPDRVEVYITRVKPQQCGPLIKDLQHQCGSREEAIAHLKRVRKCKGGQPSATENNDSPPTKKAKTADMLEVLLGAVSHENKTDDWTPLLTKYACTLETRRLPGRPAESKEELEEFNKEWPTVYFHKQTEQHKQEELALTSEEANEMHDGMQHAIQDACRARELCGTATATTSLVVTGAIIICPVTHKVVATANEERQLQQTAGDCVPDFINPLCTSVLLTIQGVSRKERAAAVGHGMDSEAFQKGQYLCTGYGHDIMCDDCERGLCANFFSLPSRPILAQVRLVHDKRAWSVRGHGLGSL